ncbi:hypothetical protein F5883DRAFT_596652 [Diaporthe sp. PMI_573]|nr:hypothetical protein F5883DRAFT_596652 [Diaporthaceae sp. PMI_573]
MLGVISVTVVDVARIYYLQLAAVISAKPPSSQLSTGLQSSYYGNIALFLSAIEVNVAIIGASIPTLAPLLKRLIPSKESHGTQDDCNGALVRSASSEGEPRDSNRLAELPRQASYATGPASTNRSKAISTTISVDDRSQMDMRGLPTERDHAESFGFIQMARPKCLVDIRGFECAKYCTIGMVSASYGGAGLLSPFLGYAILHYVGFKATFTTSLAIFCVGTLIFWPSGALGSYPGFIIASVVVGVALASIEIAASTFNALCGPSEYAVIRVLLGTGLEAVGATLGFFLGYTAISINVDDTRGLIALQWAYFVIALFTVLLGLFFYYIPLPEATESDLQSQPDLLWVDPSQKYFGIFPVIFTPLLLAVLSCFCAAGALASLRSFIGSVLTVVSTSTHSVPMLSITDFQTAITAIYASGNFFFAFLCFLIPPRLVLLGAYASGITFGVLIIALQHHSVDSVQAITLAFSAFQGAIPNLCYAIVLHGLGRWTKLACCAMIGGASLGASIWPWVMLTVASGHSAQYAFCIVIALFTAGCSFPLYLNLDPVARGWGRPPGWRTVANVIQQYRS